MNKHMNVKRWACSTTWSAWLLSLVSLLLLVACGGALPPRFVLERDLGAFVYRRYQKVLDVEIVIEGNPAVGHTATYVRRDRGRAVAFSTAFVSVYEHAKGLAEETREQLKELASYELSVVALEGDYVHRLDGGGERWAIWVSGNHLVKIGAPAGEDFPEELAAAYLDVYPSDLLENGKARADTPSAGPSRAQLAERAEEANTIQREGTGRNPSTP